MANSPTHQALVPASSSSSSSSSSTNSSINPIGITPADLTWPSQTSTPDETTTNPTLTDPHTHWPQPLTTLSNIHQINQPHHSPTISPMALSPHTSTTPSESRSTTPSLAPSNTFLLTTPQLTHPLNRAPPSTPPTFHSTHPSAYSMPTVPSMSHPSSLASEVLRFRLIRANDAPSFDAETMSIKADLIDAKVRRGGAAYLKREEYTVELASREDAAMMEELVNREGMAGGADARRSRASTVTEMGEGIVTAVATTTTTTIEEGVEGGVEGEEVKATTLAVDTLLISLLGSSAVEQLKSKLAITTFGDMESATTLLKEAREAGKYVARIE